MFKGILKKIKDENTIKKITINVIVNTVSLIVLIFLSQYILSLIFFN